MAELGIHPPPPLQKVIQGQGIIKFYQILTRRKRNSTARKLNQKHLKGREGRKAGKGRKGWKRTGKGKTKQRKQEQRGGRGKSTRKKRSSKKRGKRKWKGKNRRGARNWFGSRGLRPLSLGPRLGITNISDSGMTKIFVRQRQGQRHCERLSKVVTL